MGSVQQAAEPLAFGNIIAAYIYTAEDSSISLDCFTFTASILSDSLLTSTSSDEFVGGWAIAAHPHIQEALHHSHSLTRISSCLQHTATPSVSLAFDQLQVFSVKLYENPERPPR